jgi:hypothetical protein
MVAQRKDVVCRSALSSVACCLKRCSSSVCVVLEVPLHDTLWYFYIFVIYVYIYIYMYVYIGDVLLGGCACTLM